MSDRVAGSSLSVLFAVGSAEAGVVSACEELAARIRVREGGADTQVCPVGPGKDEVKLGVSAALDQQWHRLAGAGSGVEDSGGLRLAISGVTANREQALWLDQAIAAWLDAKGPEVASKAKGLLGVLPEPDGEVPQRLRFPHLRLPLVVFGDRVGARPLDQGYVRNTLLPASMDILLEVGLGENGPLAPLAGGEGALLWGPNAVDYLGDLTKEQADWLVDRVGSVLAMRSLSDPKSLKPADIDRYASELGTKLASKTERSISPVDEFRGEQQPRERLRDVRFLSSTRQRFGAAAAAERELAKDSELVFATLTGTAREAVLVTRKAFGSAIDGLQSGVDRAVADIWGQVRTENPETTPEDLRSILRNSVEGDKLLQAFAERAGVKRGGPGEGRWHLVPSLLLAGYRPSQHPRWPLVFGGTALAIAVAGAEVWLHLRGWVPFAWLERFSGHALLWLALMLVGLVLCYVGASYYDFRRAEGRFLEAVRMHFARVTSFFRDNLLAQWNSLLDEAAATAQGVLTLKREQVDELVGGAVAILEKKGDHPAQQQPAGPAWLRGVGAKILAALKENPADGDAIVKVARAFTTPAVLLDQSDATSLANGVGRIIRAGLESRLTRELAGAIQQDTEVARAVADELVRRIARLEPAWSQGGRGESWLVVGFTPTVEPLIDRIRDGLTAAKGGGWQILFAPLVGPTLLTGLVVNKGTD